jgi:hypothetical protein
MSLTFGVALLFVAGFQYYYCGLTVNGFGQNNFKLWTNDLDNHLTSRALFDWFALAHFNQGLISFMFFQMLNLSKEFSFNITVFLQLVFECYENTASGILRAHGDGYTNYNGDSLINSCMDSILVYLAARLCFTNKFIDILILCILTETILFQVNKFNVTTIIASQLENLKK